MWLRVDRVWTDVSEERIASIFRVENSASEEPVDWWLSMQPLAHALRRYGLALSIGPN
jgi:hypothetical protein